MRMAREGVVPMGASEGFKATLEGLHHHTHRHIDTHTERLKMPTRI